MDSCNDCLILGDFSALNDAKADLALKQANHTDIVATLDALNLQGVSDANLARVLHVPQRAPSDWRAGRFADSVPVLLHLVRHFPALLEFLDKASDGKKTNIAEA